jgi:hypothetical protein
VFTHTAYFFLESRIRKIPFIMRDGGASRPITRRATLATTVEGYIDDSGYTEYTLNTTFHGQHYIVAQRYSAFLELHENYLSNYEPLCFQFPVPKALFVHEGEKRKRVAGLQSYLDRILDELASTQAAPPRELLEFLGVPPALGLHSGKYA